MVAGQSRMEVTHVELRGMRMEYATLRHFGCLGLNTIGRAVSGFGPQNLGEGFEEWGSTWRNHRGCVEVKQIYEGSMVVRSIEKELDHYALGSSDSAQNIYGQIRNV